MKLRGLFKTKRTCTLASRKKLGVSGLVNTIRFIGISTPLNLIIPLAAAMMVQRVIKGRQWFSLIFLIPLVIPSESMVFFWKTLFSYEAAWMENDSPLQVFRHITLPCLLSTVILAVIMSIINSFKIFREIYLITGSYPNENIYSLQHFMNNMFTSLNYPRLTSATVILVFIIIFLTQFLLRFERKVAQ